MADVGAASVITPSVSTAVTYAIGSATAEAATASQIFNPLFGYRISDPLVLPGTPVTGSVVRWTATTPAAGSTVTVETSINGGVTWDLATNGGQVPRLRTGDTTTLSVLTRITLSRLLAGDATPRVQSLELRVSCDASVDELVAVGHGIITKTTAQVGQGSGRGSGGGSGVSGSGGGQSGIGLSIKIKCVDPSRAISKNPWLKPFVLNTVPYHEGASAMVADRLPTQEDYNVTTVARDTDVLIFGLDQGSDAWQDIRDLGTACGSEAFFDNAGAFTFRPVTDPRIAQPVWTFDDGTTCTVTQIERELTDDQTLNYIVVKGESTASQNAVSAVAFDDDPASPTYVFGRFGPHGTVVTLPSVTTEDQAQIAANAILFASIGAAETTTITTVPIPMLECGDCVTVAIGDVKADGRYVINQMTTPLSPGGAQTLTCFRQSERE